MTTLRSSNMATETHIYIYINRPWRLLHKSSINGVFLILLRLLTGGSSLKKKDKMWETELLPHHANGVFLMKSWVAPTGEIQQLMWIRANQHNP